MKKYVLYIDYRAGFGPKPYGIEYKVMDARSIEEAIEEADCLTGNDDTIYLVRIFQKVGRVVKPNQAGYKWEAYEPVMCRRSTWHRNIPANGESMTKIKKCWSKDDIWFEIMSDYEEDYI